MRRRLLVTILSVVALVLVGLGVPLGWILGVSAQQQAFVVRQGDTVRFATLAQPLLAGQSPDRPTLEVALGRHEHIRSVKTVVIDGLNGYQSAMPDENFLILHIHELLQYLNRRGATTFLTVAQHGLMGDMKSPVDLTYLADTVVLLRYFEALGRVRRAISVIKKRSSAHEDTIREYRIGANGLTLGEPLVSCQGVLRGVPTLVPEKSSLARDNDG